MTGNRNIRKRILSVCLAFQLLAVTAISAFAATNDSSAARGNVVRMGYFEFGGMFEGAEDGARKSGYCYEYMMQIATYTGWNYEFCYGSYAELYEKLKAGEIDILPYTNYNEQRGREVLFSEKALAEEEYYIVTIPGRVMSVDGLNGKLSLRLRAPTTTGFFCHILKKTG